MVTTNETGILPTTPSFSGSASEVRQGSRISVLYIDETPALLDIVCQYLEMNGEMMVDTALTQEDAIEKMRYISYDVIVTDYNIDHGTGNTLLYYTRSMGNQIPFIYFVLFRSDDLETDARQYGNVRFIEKIGTCYGSPFPNLYQAILAAAVKKTPATDADTETDQSFGR